MKRHFGFRNKIEPPEIGIGSFYIIFSVLLLVVCLALIHP